MGKYKKCLGEPSDSFFQTDAKKINCGGKYNKFFDRIENNFFVTSWLVRWPRLLQYRLPNIFSFKE